MVSPVFTVRLKRILGWVCWHAPVSAPGTRSQGQELPCWVASTPFSASCWPVRDLSLKDKVTFILPCKRSSHPSSRRTSLCNMQTPFQKPTANQKTELWRPGPTDTSATELLRVSLGDTCRKEGERRVSAPHQGVCWH